MGFKESCRFLSFVVLLAVVAEATVAPHRPIDAVRRSSFPKDFVWGTASSAYQYEGAAFTDGKGPSIWDNFTHQHPEKIFDRSTGDVALDTYHRYKEDLVIMKNIGFEAYRFSIAWSRILPKGKLSGGINQKGIDYYNNLINEMLAKGITPYATLFHWDVPQALQDEYQGFIGYQIVNDFRDYAEVCYKAFGDRVKHWITLNEPWSFSMAGYAQGALAPGRCSEWQVEFNCLGGDSSTEPYIVAHNQILAHAEAVKVYKTKYQARQKGTIGITLVTLWYTPYSSSEADERAARRALEFSLGWFMHPLTYGDYPPVMRALVKERLPQFTRAQSLLVKGSYEFLGLNYYTTNYAKHNPKTPDFKPSYLNDYLAILSTDRNGVSIGPKVNESSWQAAYPQGFRDLLIHTKEKYQNPIIYITENGHLDFDGPAKEMIEDRLRVKFHHDHLMYLNEAIKAGVRVKGYFAWSFFDNFEWASGYFIRFGLVYIDYKDNLKRIPKLSAKWFQNFLKQ